MKIFCLCIVKDEDDVLEEAIGAAARWADGVFISDNGSTDNTPSLIRQLTHRYPNIFDIGPTAAPFTDALRAEMFARVRQHSRRGVWWCRLDADEIYIDDPRDFLSRLPGDVDTVWTSTFQFYFTQNDLQKYEENPAAFLSMPVTDRLRYYRNDWSEIRFVRHTFPFIWKGQWPQFRCNASAERIRLRHYQYRSPEQIKKRLINRRQVAEQTGGAVFPHEIADRLKDDNGTDLRPQAGSKESPNEIDYRQRVVSPDGLDYYSGGPYVERESELPPIQNIRPSHVPKVIWKSLCLTRCLVRRLLKGSITG